MYNSLQNMHKELYYVTHILPESTSNTIKQRVLN